MSEGTLQLEVQLRYRDPHVCAQLLETLIRADNQLAVGNPNEARRCIREALNNFIPDQPFDITLRKAIKRSYPQ